MEHRDQRSRDTGGRWLPLRTRAGESAIAIICAVLLLLGSWLPWAEFRGASDPAATELLGVYRLLGLLVCIFGAAAVTVALLQLRRGVGLVSALVLLGAHALSCLIVVYAIIDVQGFIASPIGMTPAEGFASLESKFGVWVVLVAAVAGAAASVYEIGAQRPTRYGGDGVESEQQASWLHR